MRKFFVDMDCTLTKYSDEYPLKQYTKGFFENLEVVESSIDFLKLLQESIGRENLYILSKLPVGKSYAKKEKITWLNKYFSFIPKDNYIFVPGDKNKGEYLLSNFKSLEKTKNILLDDHTKNLIEWEQVVPNSQGIKVLNGFNNITGVWKNLNGLTITII